MDVDSTKITAEEVKDLLAQRFCPPEYLFMTEFALEAHEDDIKASTRYIDAYAFCNVPSWGHTFQAFEIKVARSDWLNELRQPWKAEAAAGQADKFWLVAPQGVVKPEELPPKWGLMVVQKNRKGLRIAQQAASLRDPLQSLPIGDVAFMLRKGLRELQGQALRQAYNRGRKEAGKELDDLKLRLRNCRDHISTVNNELGVQLINNEWSEEPLDRVMVARLKAALKLSDEKILNYASELERAVDRITQSLPRLVGEVKESVELLGATARLHPAGVIVGLDSVPISAVWEHLDDGTRRKLLRLALPDEVENETLDRFWGTHWHNLNQSAQAFLKRLSPEQVRKIVKDGMEVKNT